MGTVSGKTMRPTLNQQLCSTAFNDKGFEYKKTTACFKKEQDKALNEFRAVCLVTSAACFGAAWVLSL